MIGCTLRFSVYVHFPSVERLRYTQTFSLVCFSFLSSTSRSVLFVWPKEKWHFVFVWARRHLAVWGNTVWWPFSHCSHWEHNPLLHDEIAKHLAIFPVGSFHSIVLCLDVLVHFLCVSHSHSLSHLLLILWWISRPNLSQILKNCHFSMEQHFNFHKHTRQPL